MRSRIGLALVVAAFALTAAPAASPYGGPQPNPKAVENCERNIDKQSEKGIAAGGGKKEGILAPTNCDHFFNP
jgi:hypothetical protein